MEDAVPMHVFNRFQQLVDVEFDPRLRQVIRPPFDGFIEVHLHKLKDKG